MKLFQALDAAHLICYTLVTSFPREGANMKAMTFTSEFLSAAKQAPRIYFAPLVGAYKAIKAEMAKAGGGDRSAKIPPKH